MSTDHEKLITEAAKAIWFVRHVGDNTAWGEMAWAEQTAPDDWSSEALDAVDAARAAFAVFEKAHTPTEPAFIGIMPPSPETSKRWWTMYCRECGIEEGMADTADDPRLIQRRDEHNRTVHTPTGDEREALDDTLRREFEYRIRTAVAYGAMKGYRETPSQVRADWIQHEIAGAMASRAVAGFRRTVQDEPDWEYGAVYELDGKWFDLDSQAFTIREVAQKAVDGYNDPQVVLGQRTKAGPWVPVVDLPEGGASDAEG